MLLNMKLSTNLNLCLNMFVLFICGNNREYIHSFQVFNLTLKEYV
jgi:hypothetical protein